MRAQGLIECEGFNRTPMRNDSVLTNVVPNPPMGKEITIDLREATLGGMTVNRTEIPEADNTNREWRGISFGHLNMHSKSVSRDL